MTFQIRLHRFVLIHRAGKAIDQIAGKGKSLTGTRFVFRNQPAGDGHIYFQQAIHPMCRSLESERVQPYAAPRCEINDVIRSNFVTHDVASSPQTVNWECKVVGVYAGSVEFESTVTIKPLMISITCALRSICGL